MRLVAKLLSFVPVVAGLGLLWLALARYRLPYENQRYFDAQTGTVYHFEAAEVLLIAAIVLIVAGLAIAGSALHFSPVPRAQGEILTALSRQWIWALGQTLTA